MKKRDDGGPVFPFTDTSQNTATGETTVYQGLEGMTLRDLFAGMAMHALLSRGVISPDDEMAKRAYERADVMLRERAR